MTDIIICISTNLFRVYLISRFMHIFWDDKKDRDCGDRLKACMVYGGFFLINTAAYLVFHMVWINIACNLAGIGLIALLYTKSVRSLLFVTCSVYVINMGCDTVSTLLFINYKDGTGFSQVYEVITVFLIFLCEVLTEKIVDVRRKPEKIRNMSIGLIPLCSIGMFCAMIYTKSSTETGLVIVSIGLLLINFFTLCLYNMQSEILAGQYENAILHQRVESYADQLDIMLQGEEKVRALKHDMKHHLNELKILAAVSEDRAIEEYIGSMEQFMENPDELVSSGNLEIDSVMNHLLRRAKQELLTVDADVRLPKSADHSFDINVILGNLLENAIEAARQTEEKKLRVKIGFQQGILKIRIENSYTGKLEKRRRKLLTTKNAEGIHGIGLENVRKIVEKYDGTMEICPDGDMFRVVLLLYMPELKE